MTRGRCICNLFRAFEFILTELTLMNTPNVVITKTSHKHLCWLNLFNSLNEWSTFLCLFIYSHPTTFQLISDFTRVAKVGQHCLIIAGRTIVEWHLIISDGRRAVSLLIEVRACIHMEISNYQNFQSVSSGITI